MVKKIHLLLASVFFLSACAGIRSQRPSVAKDVADTIAKPQAIHEFRAAWVATVANINWPSQPGLSTEQQQKEAIDLLNFLQDHNFNAVIFQVRPQADALYPSNLEPWSYYLTGQHGQAPSPYYDPLQFWIEEAHKRGLELHVWLNPYRAHHPSAGAISSQSIVHKMPESVVYLKEGYWWFDPSLKSTQDHSVNVVKDLVKRYDIDGVHFDDYFYPYTSYNKGDDFPDETSYQAYKQSGGQLAKNDWRRKSVNQFIKRVYQEIKKEKKYVKFGISPFGIWRPDHPSTIVGMDQYDALYADARLWLNEGWVDYFSPQLYWPIQQIPQSFPILLKWWIDENKQNRHLWPGMNVGRRGDERNVDEVINQIMITRALSEQGEAGTVHWSIGPLLKYPKVANGLLEGPYKEQALIPVSTWLGNAHLSAPKVDDRIDGNTVTVQIQPSDDIVYKWIIYLKRKGNWSYKIVGRQQMTNVFNITDPSTGDDPLNRIEIAAIDRLGNEGKRVVLNIRP